MKKTKNIKKKKNELFHVYFTSERLLTPKFVERVEENIIF